MGELDGNDEGIRKLLDGLSPEQRVAGLAPERVLALYDTEQLLLALPDNALRSLSAEYLAMLSEGTRAAIRARIGGGCVEDEVDIRTLDGYDEVVQKINQGIDEDIEARKKQIRLLVARLPPDHPLAGLTPEEVLAKHRSDPTATLRTREEVLAGVPSAETLAIFTQEQLLASLPPEQRLLAMPDEVLRNVGDEYLATLSEPMRAAIRARIGR